MRISTQQQFLRSIDDMQRSQSRIADLQDQISTGKRLRNPSDDPVGAAQVVKLERELSQYNKYDDNINVTQRRLEQEDSILDSINIATDRMRELTIQSGSDTLNDADRSTIAQELNQLVTYVAGLMNTQDAQGEYLFAGNKGGDAPYVKQGDGSYEFVGDDGQRLIQVGSDLFVPSNDSGEDLFESIDGPLQVGLTGQAVFNAAQQMPAVEPFVRNTEFATLAAETTFKEATKGLGELTIRVTEPTPDNFEYSVFDSSGAPVKDASGNDIANIAVGDIAATPAQITIHGLSLELHEPADIASANEIKMSVTPEKMNVLDAATALATVLSQPIENAEMKTERNEAVARALEQFKMSADQTTESQTVVGSRLKTLENVSSSNLDFKLFTEKAISTIEDADMAKVISEFTLEQTTLQAAQATFGRVSSLSLFNYIN